MATYGDEDTIKNRAGVTADDLGLTQAEFDDLVTALNERASDTVERFTHRDFAKHEAEVEKKPGNNRDRIRTKGYPILDVTSLKVDDDTIPADEFRVPDEDMLGENPGVIELKNRVFRKGWENVEITYDWGYEDPPPMVRQVVEDMVVETLGEARANTEGGAGLASVSMDGYSVSFKDLQVDRLTEDRRASLEPLRRVIGV